MEHQVEIKKGIHSTKIPSGVEKLFKRLLGSANFSEEFSFEIMLGGRVKGSGQCKEIEVRKQDPKGRSIIVFAKPGDNGTRFEYFVFRPNGYSGTLEDFFNQLKDAEKNLYSKDNKQADEEVEPVLENLGVKNTTKKPEKTGTALPAPEPKKYRLVSETLDEETIRIILIDVFDAKKDPVLRVDLKNRIRSFDLNCDEDQIILFLTKNDHVRESKRINQAKIFFSLGKKGEELLSRNDSHAGSSTSSNSAHEEQKTLPPKIVPAPDLVELSREFNKLKEVLSAEKEILVVKEKDFAKAEKALADQQAKVKKMTEIKEEVKKRIEAILLDS